MRQWYKYLTTQSTSGVCVPSNGRSLLCVMTPRHATPTLCGWERMVMAALCNHCRRQWSTVRCYYKVVNFLPNPRKIHPIVCPSGWAMGCILWVQIVIYTLPQSLQWCMQYHVILDHAIMALDCTKYFIPQKPSITTIPFSIYCFMLHEQGLSQWENTLHLYNIFCHWLRSCQGWDKKKPIKKQSRSPNWSP